MYAGLRASYKAREYKLIIYICGVCACELCNQFIWYMYLRYSLEAMDSHDMFFNNLQHRRSYHLSSIVFILTTFFYGRWFRWKSDTFHICPFCCRPRSIIFPVWTFDWKNTNRTKWMKCYWMRRSFEWIRRRVDKRAIKTNVKWKFQSLIDV